LFIEIYESRFIGMSVGVLLELFKEIHGQNCIAL
jgi:hypothetical protein